MGSKQKGIRRPDVGGRTAGPLHISPAWARVVHIGGTLMFSL